MSHNPKQKLKPEIISQALPRSNAPHQLSTWRDIRRILAKYPVAKLRLVQDGYNLEARDAGITIRIIPIGNGAHLYIAGWHGRLNWRQCMLFVELALSGYLRVKAETSQGGAVKWSLELCSLKNTWHSILLRHPTRGSIIRKDLRGHTYAFPMVSTKV